MVKRLYRKVASSRLVYYSILQFFGQRSHYISIKFSLHKPSENLLLTETGYCSRLYGRQKKSSKKSKFIKNSSKESSKKLEILQKYLSKTSSKKFVKIFVKKFVLRQKICQNIGFLEAPIVGKLKKYPPKYDTFSQSVSCDDFLPRTHAHSHT